MKYDFRHIDPRTGIPRVKRDEDKIELMSRTPWRSGWIYLLQNRIGLNTVGNIRYKKKLWYDCKDHTVSSNQSKEDAEDIRTYILPGAGRPAGWIDADYIRETRLYNNKKSLFESEDITLAKKGKTIICWTENNSYPYIGTIVKGKVGVYSPGAGKEIGCYLDFDTITQWDYVDDIYPNNNKDINTESISESLEYNELPEYLYHATPACYLRSIRKYGLGGKMPKHRFWDYEGTEYENKLGVFLATDDSVAYSYVECSDEFDELADEYEDRYDSELKILVFKIRTSDLDTSKLSIDTNNMDSEDPTYFYDDIIPFNLLEKVDTSDYE